MTVPLRLAGAGIILFAVATSETINALQAESPTIEPTDTADTPDLSWLHRLSPGPAEPMPIEHNMPSPDPKLGLDRRDLMVVAEMIKAEAGSEPREGKIAVAWTVKNRQARPENAKKSLRDLIDQPYQYSRTANPGEDLILIAALVLQNVEPDPTGSATHFWAPKLFKDNKAPYWSHLFPKTKTIGGHNFHRMPS
jgi:N-acetylmuramoyl-L-alanine amidase